MGSGGIARDLPLRGVSDEAPRPRWKESGPTRVPKFMPRARSGPRMEVTQMTERGAQIVDERLVRVTAGPATLKGELRLPERAHGIVLFAHGSGSGRRSSRNRHVARLLNEAKLATLLIDLLTSDEDAIDQRTARLRFDIGLLA